MHFLANSSQWSNGQLWQKSVTVYPAVRSNQTDILSEVSEHETLLKYKVLKQLSMYIFFLGLSYSHISTSPLFIISINLSLVEKQLYPSNLLNSFILSFILISLYLILWFYYLLYESCSNFQFTPRSLMVENVQIQNLSPTCLSSFQKPES